jgi:peptidoglycan/LPS O-acetylase OafA/YrhL
MRGIFDDSTGNRAFIDLLRTIGILQVVLFHVIHGIVRFAPTGDLPTFIERMPFWMNFAWQAYGVDMIFVISAFLLTWSLLLEHDDTGWIDFRSYYVRRLSRILPLYYIALVAFAIGQGNSVSEIALSALFIGYIVSDYNVIPVGWSMEVMILYYLVLPWILVGLNKARRPVLWLTFAIIAVSVWRYLYLMAQPEDPARLFLTMIETKASSPAGFELYFRPWFRLPALLMGTVLAYLLANRMIPKTWITPVIAVVFIVPILWLPVQDGNSFVYRWMSPALWAIYWALAPVIFARAFGFLMVWGMLRGLESPWKIPAIFRVFSLNIFSVYLFHMPFLAVAAVIVFQSTDVNVLGKATIWHVMAAFAVTSLLTYIVALPVTRYIERPMQQAIRRKLQ